ncbi:MAG: hypothetical protein CGU28_12645 [Candidatus Dactylopiibacterium carminicum]|uniref:Uncharacterized protein n=1 Tax=Candidatus Dactylopiibacterium carminicum TaxID=857335 RepID=A0A272EPN6_9RHOO|nr:hypothetical protein BGI27_13795 [Candidatus Dactylopiibacterium carminicum]PAS92059.1 MAG: hypothetical protein CGU29_13325 [Candidatus Dactylopiibacterium carminicum]PAS95485.1 MAG: hypothetical protein CGU28_12645 [Candidatus Dactylopiibacterium carminicum]PAS97376.1 MAG: hypothetical protein BSR46_13820 [Candidatus Dactylopiibacterium carminicum]
MDTAFLLKLQTHGMADTVSTFALPSPGKCDKPLETAQITDKGESMADFKRQFCQTALIYRLDTATQSARMQSHITIPLITALAW